MFQSLTGSIHTCSIFRRIHGGIVSIPHRFNSHRAQKSMGTSRDLVSIPHRFNSHSFIPRFNIFPFHKFQSLTGSIHTVYGEECYYDALDCFNPSQVQFTLYCEFAEVAPIDLFQSLTGSIHTNYEKNQAVYCWCFNPSQVQFTPEHNSHIEQEFVSFNPSQVQFTQIDNSIREATHFKFQSLTGSIYTHLNLF